MAKGMLDPENTIEDVKIRIQKSYKNPNVGTITQAVLKEGPQAFKVATLMEIVNPSSGEFHHYSLQGLWGQRFMGSGLSFILTTC